MTKKEAGGKSAPPLTMHDRDESISARDYSRLRQLIYDEAGIALGPERKTMLEVRIRRRLKELAIHSYGEYCDHLFSRQGMESELDHLIDVVTTNKTDFFREPGHFELLTTKVLATLSSNPLLVWSAGCSTGEEPYTLAMVLSEHALAHSEFSFRILATDVSTTVLRKAQLGIYSSEAVRPVPTALKVKYLLRSRDPGAERVRVAPELRRLVDFRRLNFMESDYGITRKVSVVFCRNVIIYFDRLTQQRILRRITDCLEPGGYLFVGHAETLHALDLPLVPIAPTLYRRIDESA